jgi:hypothetical protein
MDKYNLKSIEFVLENCECIQIDKKFIYQLLIGKTTFSYHWQNHLNYINPSYKTEYCKIQFTNEFNENSVYYPFEEHFKGNTVSAYDRLTKYRDTTSIILHFDNNENKQISIPWKGNDFINKSQRFKNNSIEWENKNFVKEIFYFLRRNYYLKVYYPLKRWSQNKQNKYWIKQHNLNS